MGSSKQIHKLCSLFAQEAVKTSLAGVLAFPPTMKQVLTAIVQQSFHDYLSTGNRVFGYNMSVVFSDLPSNYPEMLRTITGDQLLVRISFGDKDEGGKVTLANGGRKALLLNIVDKGGTYDASNVNDLIEHELSHVVQVYMMELYSKQSKPGMPSEWQSNQDPIAVDPKKGNSFDDEYYASGIEFFPYLTNEISAFKNSRFKTKADLLGQIKGSPFMSALRSKQPKMYERAVKELWKAVAPLLDTDPKSEQAAQAATEAMSNLQKNMPQIIQQIRAFAGEVSDSFSLDECPSNMKQILQWLSAIKRESTSEASIFFFERKQKLLTLKHLNDELKASTLVSIQI